MSLLRHSLLRHKNPTNIFTKIHKNNLGVIVMNVIYRSRVWLLISFAFLLSACDSFPFDDDDDDNPPATNSAPAFTSANTASTPEGSTAAGYTAAATDPDAGDSVSYSISGGADAAQFSINSASGVLSFASAPNFITPADADADNVYEVQLTADDGNSENNTATLALSVTVTADNQVPVFSSATTASVAEGSTDTGYTAEATDDNGDTLAYSISGGADQALFSIDSATGVLSFLSAPQFDTPADANTDNDYEVQITADDSRSGTAALDLVVSVTASSSISLRLTYPTPNANLGGGVMQTSVNGRVIDSSGAPVALADIDYVDVNGTRATLDVTDPGRWTTRAIAVTDGGNTLDFVLALTAGGMQQGSVEVENFIAHGGFGDSVYDAANNRILVADAGTQALLSVDPSTGLRAVISSPDVGTGPNFQSIRGITLDAANSRVLAVDWRRETLTAIDLATGNRTDISSVSIGTGPIIDGPNDVVIDAANDRALIAAYQASAVIAVDLGTGNRTVISDSDGPNNDDVNPVGTGPELGFMQGIGLDSASNRALVSANYDPGTGSVEAIIAIDLANGNRSILSDESTGTGPNFSSPLDMVVDSPGNRVLVADQTQGLFSIDLANGNRTVVTKPTDFYGANESRVQSVALDAAADVGYVPDSTQDVIFEVDLGTTTRTVLSSSDIGSGAIETEIYSMTGIAHDVANNRVLLPSRPGDLVVQADLGSGDRAVVSSAAVGAGPSFASTGNVAIDADGNRLILTDTGLNALIAMDLGSGNRSILSDNASVGSGPAFATPNDVALDLANDRAIVLDSTGLISVNLTTGDRTIIANDVTGAGPSIANADAVDIDVAAGFAYVADIYAPPVFQHWIYKVNLASGDRSILSDSVSVGTGTALNFPQDLALDISGNRALVLNRGGVQPNLMAVDLTTGNRIIVSGAGVGSGQEFGSNERLDLDLQNDRAFVYDLAVGGVIVVDLTTGERAVATK